MKLQLADYQLATIFFCLICTTESENSPQNSSSFTPIQRQKLISQFLTPYHFGTVNKERRKSVVDVVVTFLTTIAERRLCRDGCV